MGVHLHVAPTFTQSGSDPSAPSPIRVVLADDHALMRHSLRLLLDGEEHIDVIAEAADLASAERDVHRHKPHVLVVDLGLSNADGSSVEAIGSLRERMPDTQIVALTMEEGPVFARRAIAAGVLGFVLKELADSDLPQAIRAAARGEEYISPRVADRLDALHQPQTDRELTPREVDVLRLVALGHTSVEIADELQIPLRMVESHRSHIHNKLGLAPPSLLAEHSEWTGPFSAVRTRRRSR
jgi:two-component system response regulator NreC